MSGPNSHSRLSHSHALLPGVSESLPRYLLHLVFVPSSNNEYEFNLRFASGIVISYSLVTGRVHSIQLTSIEYNVRACVHVVVCAFSLSLSRCDNDDGSFH